MLRAVTVGPRKARSRPSAPRTLARLGPAWAKSTANVDFPKYSPIGKLLAAENGVECGSGHTRIAGRGAESESTKPPLLRHRNALFESVI